ncbi:response regulator [Asticcacaulis sp. 201]|uniref:response regulator n=1 Tax=Asticcacaulis sp. 201 TaxID=3028787 RepID=UPI002916F2FC|nr:response regulator [Asticcacaulis sp. 201]MDV6330775.1 response regulator [Asticcacaulis sp. 201]
MDSQISVLVVDDDHDIRTLLRDHLEGNGFTCRIAEDGRAMIKALERDTYDLVVLDLNLPGEDGLTLCRNLRAKSELPVIMLTARGDPIDRIVGLEMGADDYLTKPFEPRELTARIRNVLRRQQRSQSQLEQVQARRAHFQGWTLDLERRHLIDSAGRVIMLSGADFRYLRALTDNANIVLSREQLARAGGAKPGEFIDRAVDLQISRLRAKLGDDARTPSLIKTVRSEGYVLACPVEHEL